MRVFSPTGTTMTASTPTIPAAGGTQTLTLSAGGALANTPYLIIGSATGTIPGAGLGVRRIPLQFDGYTLTSLTGANTAVFVNTVGILDGNGATTAAISLPSSIASLLVGTRFWHAAVAGSGQLDVAPFTSNAVSLRITQ